MPSVARSEVEAVARQLAAVLVATRERARLGRLRHDTPEHAEFRRRVCVRVVQILLDEGERFNEKNADRVTNADFITALASVADRFR